MSVWDRSPFVLSAAEHEVYEAIVALTRVLQNSAVSESTRFAIQGAINTLRAEQSAPASSGANTEHGARNPRRPGDAATSSPTSGARPA
jgi:hypothetical protein